MNYLKALALHYLSSDKPAVAIIRSSGVQIIFLILSLGSGVLSARLLGADGRGIFAAITTLPILLGGLATSGTWSAVVVRLRQAPNLEEKGAVVGNSMILCLAASTGAAIFGYFATPYALSSYPKEVVNIAVISLIAIYPLSFQVIYRQTFAGIGAYKAYNVFTLLPQFLYVVSLILVAPIVVLTPAIVTLALFGSLLFTLILQTPLLTGRISPRFNMSSITRMPAFASFVFRAGGHDVVAVLSGSLDKLFLIPLVSPAELGIYVVAFSLSRTLMFAQPAIGSVFLSSMSDRPVIEMKFLHDVALRVTIAALLPIGALFAAAAPFIIALAYGKDFYIATSLFSLLLIDAFMQCLIAITTQLYMSSDRPGLVSIIYTLSFLALAMAMVMLVPSFGIAGAAMAAVVASFIRFALLYFGILTSLKLPLPRLHLNYLDLQYVRSRALKR